MVKIMLADRGFESTDVTVTETGERRLLLEAHGPSAGALGEWWEMQARGRVQVAVEAAGVRYEEVVLLSLESGRAGKPARAVCEYA